MLKALPSVKIDWSEPGMVVSGAVHLALLSLAIVSFSDTKPFEDAQEAIAVEVVSASQLSQMTRGEQAAKDVKPDAKPRVAKLSDVQELKTDDLRKDVPVPPSRPQDQPPEPKPVAIPAPPERPKDTAEEEKAKEDKAKAEADAKARADAAAAAKAEAAAKAAEAAKAKAEADAKAKAIAEQKEAEALERAKAAKAEAEAKARAEARAKAEAEAEAEKKRLAVEAEQARREAEAEKKRKEVEARQKAAEAQRLAALAEAAKEPPKPSPAPPKPDRKFDPAAIEKLLTSKEQAQNAPSTGREINRTASLGAPTATGKQLSPSQKAQLGALIKEQIERCMALPAGSAEIKTSPRFSITIAQSGSLQAQPVLVNASGEPGFQAVADSIRRAIVRCAPYNLPPNLAPPDSYSDWKDWTINFDPKAFAQ